MTSETFSDSELEKVVDEWMPKIDWVNFLSDVYTTMDGLKSFFRMSYLLRGKSAQLEHLLKNKRILLRDVCIPLQRIMYEHKVTQMVTENPVCLNPLKSG